MLFRYRYYSIPFALALFLVTSITVTLLVHIHTIKYYRLHDGLYHRGIDDKIVHRDQVRSHIMNLDTKWQNSSHEVSTERKVRLTTNFTFPTIKARVKYYMGDWYKKSILPSDDLCHKIEAVNMVMSDQSVLWSVDGMVNAIQRNYTKEWLIRAYLKDAHNVITSSNHSSGFDSFILFFGDSHSHSTRLPVVAKTRFSRFAIEKSTGRPFFDPIIWPLEMNRHYSPVNQYMKLYKEGKVCEWDDKRSTLIWRGGVTGLESDKNLSLSYPIDGPRMNVVSTYFNKDKSAVNVAFQLGNPTVRSVSHKYRNVMKYCRGTDTTMVDQLKYKYLLMLEGNDVATGLKWQLASNSVVFMAKPTTVSFLMEDLLVPFVHYVPLQDDYSDLIQMVHWARENDEKCQWISDQATLFMNQLWTSQEAKRDNTAIKKDLSDSYKRQFGEVVKSCMSA